VTQKSNGHRRSILDLAPLELECMNALWPLGQATVREIQTVVCASRPRAYTTILTIMDRLARKGVVTRVKSGRAWMYRPAFSAEEARDRAVAQVVTHFFGGSAEALRAHLAGARVVFPAASIERPTAPAPVPAPRQRAAAAASSPSAESAPSAMDDTLL
jgi:predicted transcriptional regulator